MHVLSLFKRQDGTGGSRFNPSQETTYFTRGFCFSHHWPVLDLTNSDWNIHDRILPQKKMMKIVVRTLRFTYPGAGLKTRTTYPMITLTKWAFFRRKAQ